MPNITLSVPRELYEKMKKHPEVRWSEVARRAIAEYLRRIEGVTTTEELLEELGEDFRRELKAVSPASAEEYYWRAREGEWRRLSTTRASS